MKTTKEQYLNRKIHYENEAKNKSQSINFVSILRLITFIAGGYFTVLFYIKKNLYFSFFILILSIILFVVLINIHSKLIRKRQYSILISKINEDSIKRVEGQWKSFEDNGEEFIEENHNYSKDIDIFGKGSLFQYINIASTYIGRLKLKEVLASPKYNKEEIYERQQAALELSKDLEWRQNFIAEGMMINKKICNPEPLINWGKDRIEIFCNPILIFLSRVIPIITIALTILHFTNKNIPRSYPLSVIVLEIILLIINLKQSVRILDTVHVYKKSIEAYGNMLELIEKKKFNSRYLIELQKKLINKEKITATKELNKLNSIVNLVSDRKNIYYFPINIIFLWDYHCIIKLELWKKNSGQYLNQWFETIGEMEVLCSFAGIKYDNEDFVMPKFENSVLAVKAENMGHPLLTKNRVCNDIEIGSPQNVLLITGSNMSGKSTLLRTIGINLVLAYAGAPVCAKSFTCSIMDIYTCMRISDNLEENISSFYAELLRVRKVMEAVKKKEPVFFLLDEIFRGTNSKDRHIAAETLMNKLSKENVLGLVSTHDLELGELEKINKKIKNYNFREYYENNEIHFDYKLRSGVSTTQNALYLMKMVGIELEN